VLIERTEGAKRSENVPTVSARKIKTFPSRAGMGRGREGEEGINLIIDVACAFQEEKRKEKKKEKKGKE